uniref:Non-ribosomal peptide synthetase n=1 Tax=Thermosporothrix sp. COM3 TaxID=2490863 RepID=A0A455SJI8_9CHLR|nr:hypothetical protein KTC_18700 [Thermosporothrix sp. COM3]
MYESQREPIAIVGIGCRFPGANSPRDFWDLLRSGTNAIRDIPEQRWSMELLEQNRPGAIKSRRGGFLDQIDQFDWRAFRLSPREAKYIDPQHRLLLEVAWEALEDAGLPLSQIAGSKTSVYMGISWNDYHSLLTRQWSQINDYTATGSASGLAAARLSHFFDLKGPSMAIDTSCTSSLAALYLGCESLWNRSASLSLVGGVSLMLAPENAVMVSQAGLLAADGQTKTLDSEADGFSRGEGAGIVVLKPLSRVEPGDRVYALLQGVAVNHNGRNAWLTAPDQQAQQALLQSAYQEAGIEPREVDYIELHGTGFKRGDLLETEALESFFAEQPDRDQPCLVGSVKTNIGHLEAASGIASLIKVALSLYHREIPPTLNLKTLNPELTMRNLAPVRQLQPWPRKMGTPTAGATSTALNGVNAHVILTAYEAKEQKPVQEKRTSLLPISAHSTEALSAQVEGYRHYLHTASPHMWRDICYTASVRREHHPHRVAIVAASAQEAAEKLTDALKHARSGRSHRLAFLLDDTGDETALHAEPAYQRARAECEQILQRFSASPHLDEALQPFVRQVAQAAFWRSWNIEPDAVAWTGTGELAAAYLAGALTLEQAIERLLHPSEALLPAAPLPLYELQPASEATLERFLEDGYDLVLSFASPSSIGEVLQQHARQQERELTLLAASDAPLEVLALLYTCGYPINWQQLYPEPGSLVSLPLYSWQRERLWPEWLDLATISTPPEAREQPPSLSQPSERQDETPETVLISLWTEALGYPELDRDANFFALGGHSLLAEQLLAHINHHFHVRLSLSQLLQAPTPAQCAALLATLREEREETPPLPLIQPDPDHRSDPFPLTEVQHGYWIGRSDAFEISNVGNHAYIEVAAPEIDFQRFDAAIQTLLARHEMLRAILLPDGQQQIVAEIPPFSSRVIDLRALAQPTQDAQLAAFRRQMDHQILPLDRCPAFEVLIFLLDKGKTRIHLSVESLFFDAWSMNLLLHEFLHFYYRPHVPLPALELSFRDYVLAEQELRQSELYRRSQTYWEQRIPELPPAPDLPLARSAQTLKQPRFVHRSAKLSRQQWQRIKARAAQADATPSGVLLTAFANIIAAWSKSPRFSINLSIFNRLPLHQQIHQIVGDFTSLIIVGMDHSTPRCFAEQARATQQQLWRDLDHRHYSGIHVLRELARRKGDISGAVMPIVFTSFLIQDTASKDTPLWNETLYCVTQTPQVWLDHQVHETAGELIFHWESVDELFPPGLIDAMFEAYCLLLERLATEDEQAWQEVPRQLVPTEQLQQRQQANATAAPVSHALLHTLFSEQALRRPEAVAVVSPHRTLSYQQVYSGMMQLARQLRASGASPDQLIAVVMEKGWEQVVAVLGILQAGAAYLPIDPHLPTERLHYLLNHGEVTLALTQSWVDERTNWPPHVQRIHVNSLDLEQAVSQPLDSVQTPEHLAYVIYTSGSTGLPKGVMIDHRGAVNTILDINSRFNVNSNDRVFALSALNFDLSVYDIFGLLAAGGSLVIPPDGSERNPALWLELLQHERVTLWNSVPTLLHMLVEYTANDSALQQTSLRLALLSGDWIPLSLPDQARAQLPSLEIISLGGATEASIWSILYPINALEPHWKSIPYGRPMLNQRFHVLNYDLEPAPVWVPGDLYIAGIGLARGYWRDEEKTCVSFITHPRTGERLYRTGDLGRYLPDGTIEFLGRDDFQVKIQGHRIELGEIEETCLQHPDVQAAIATAITTSTGEKRLVTYIVPQQPSEAFTPSFGTSMQALQRLDNAFGLGSIRQTENRPTVQLTAQRELSAYRQRLSYRAFLPHAIPLTRLGDFLATLSQVELEGLPKYRYPSAGGIYPVQVYIAIKPGRVEGLEEGFYYYNPQTHQLVLLSSKNEEQRRVHGLANQPIFDSAAFSLFLIAHLKGIQAHYGPLARDFCLLEAGYMSQLLMTEAPRHNLGLCPIGDLDFATMQGAFGLQEGQILLHTLLGGAIDPAAASGWSFLPTTHAPADIRQSLQAFLRQKLPQYMLPSTIVVLDALPLTANGKVDRKNLPEPDLSSLRTHGPAVPPETETEKQIAAIWQELLPGATIGRYDSFFDLGGNSLLLVRLATRIRNAFPLDFSFPTLFRKQTLADLAEYIEDQLLQKVESLSEAEAQQMMQALFRS